MDDEKKPALVIKDLYKTFALPHENFNGIKQRLVHLFEQKRGFAIQHVLNDISFEVQKGEFFGIVGRNGSGKSTLLKLIAGIYAPDKGLIQINGSLTPFIELGVGFNPELTGRENVYLNGALLGFSRDEMNGMYDDIVTFAELEEFMDQKLKNYSSGMQVRLAFSIAIRANTDILLIDEVLAVGDATFQKKCYQYFKELKKHKKTVIFISHDSNALEEYCDRGILLEGGKIVRRGKISRIVKDYNELLNKHEADQDEAEEQKHPEGEKEQTRWGKGDVKVVSTKVFDAEAQKRQKIFTEEDKSFIVEVQYEAASDTERPIYGVTIFDGEGKQVFSSNTLWSEIKTNDLPAGKKVTVRWEVPNAFNSGDFSIAPAVADSDGLVIFDWIDDAARIKVRKTLKSNAYINLEHKVNVRES